MTNDNAIGILVSNQNGIYAYQVLSKNYDLFVGIEHEPLADYLSDNVQWFGELLTVQTVFDPNSDFWCENLESLENRGLYVQHSNGDFWRVESNEGDILCINPAAKWNEDAECYELPEEQATL